MAFPSMTKTTKQKLALANRAFDALYVLNNISWTSYREKLLRLSIEEEKSHRGFGSDFAKYHPDAVSVNDAARIMAVRWIAWYLTRADKAPSVKSWLSIKPSCLLAASLVANYRKQIRKTWRGLPVAELAALDYCEFVRVKEAA
jgi:hypothetical protein